MEVKEIENKIFSILIKEEKQSWSELFEKLNISPNKLRRSLDNLMKQGFIYNFYTKNEFNPDYCYYELSKFGKWIKEESKNMSKIEDVFYSIHCLEHLKNIIVCSARDWSLNNLDVWIYGIIVGWNKESLKELKNNMNWNEEAIERLEELHKRFNELLELEKKSDL